MSDRVKMPAWLPISRVLENLGWNLSRLGPGLNGTVFSSLGAERKSNTCTKGKHGHSVMTEHHHLVNLTCLCHLWQNKCLCVCGDSTASHAQQSIEAADWEL